eukprot:GGOE01008283.1.p4 GENE.GGOE01008283.1~~GGOE01008283.1.p4  ORF type:complete len:149 (-),score=16.40 GGOE01008283.1:1741-2187(-)
MGCSCSNVAPLNPTALADACHESYTDALENDRPESPQWGQQPTWYSTSSVESGSSVQSAKSMINARTVRFSLEEDPDQATTNPKPLDIPTKPALRRSSILTFKLQRPREAYYVVSPRPDAVDPLSASPATRPPRSAARPPRHPTTALQ